MEFHLKVNGATPPYDFTHFQNVWEGARKTSSQQVWLIYCSFKGLRDIYIKPIMGKGALICKAFQTTDDGVIIYIN